MTSKRSLTTYVLLIFSCFFSLAQQCPELLNPTANATNVPVDTSISWENVVGVTGYIISIGTTPGGGEIVNEQTVGSDTTFTPPFGLPESTVIYVTITLFLFNQPSIVCSSIAFTTENVTTPPSCTTLINPQDGSQNVNVSANLSWGYASKALGYRISVGTSPDLGDIADNLDLGNTLFYNPVNDFPPETTIYVKIRPYNENGIAQNCAEESFTTGPLGEPPGCTMLISPMNGAINVPLSPVIEWLPVPNATGYIVNIGSSPFMNDVLDRGIFMVTSITVIDFEPNKTYFIRIIPFNEAGEAQGCNQESFSTILGCGPFYDENTGELIYLGPEISFPDTVGLCNGDNPTRIDATDPADGYRWYKIPPAGLEILLSEASFVNLFEPGQYRYEAFNILDQDGQVIECADSKEFTAIRSSIATIELLSKVENGDLFNVFVTVSGEGDYEFALNENGPYSASNSFIGLPPGTYTLYIRDKNGCGIVEKEFVLAFPPPGFPPYFSPNGDGIKDYWQYIPPKIDPLPLSTIQIFDRFGKILATFGANDLGWDGFYNSTPMPLGGYWYKALTTDGRVFRGHFTLMR
jgi:gliding motility-associated-like protein